MHVEKAGAVVPPEHSNYVNTGGLPTRHGSCAIKNFHYGPISGCAADYAAAAVAVACSRSRMRLKLRIDCRCR